MNYVQACLRATKNLESSFNHCGSPVKLVQVCLCAVKTGLSRFNCRGGAVKLV